MSFATFDITACKAPRDTKEKLFQSIVSILQLHSSQSTTVMPYRLDIHILQPHTQAHCFTRASAKAIILLKKKGQEERNISKSTMPSFQATLRRVSHKWRSLLVLDSLVSTTKPPDSRSHIKRLLTTRPCSFSRGFTPMWKVQYSIGKDTVWS
jgi:hypothetical protein